MEYKPDIIKILVVDDSPTSRELLHHILELDPQLQVVAIASDGPTAMKILQHNHIDVVTMDIIMPGQDGFEVTRNIMETKPLPIVIVSSIYDPAIVEQGFRSMSAGALAIFSKPKGRNDPISEQIRETIKAVAGMKVFKRICRSKGFSIPFEKDLKETAIKAVAIGASLGGPVAIAAILNDLPETFPVPIFVVQHISPGFIKGFINWLSTSTKLKVKLAESGMRALPGHVYIAPEDSYLEILPNNMIGIRPATLSDLRNAAGHLFRSMANSLGSRGVGIILTGMGKDGAEELLALKKKGGYTIAQDEASCVMFGMPKEAIQIGAAREVLSLDKISTALKHLTGSV